MTRTIMTFALLSALTSGAVAGSMPMDKRITPRPRGEHYWLSSDLNKLVFWRVPERDAVVGETHR